MVFVKSYLPPIHRCNRLLKIVLFHTFATYLSDGEHLDDTMANKIKVAIAGATGNTGSSIVNALLKSPELFVSWILSDIYT